MRLSEERINHIARQIVNRWVKTRSVRVAGDRFKVETRVAKTVLNDLKVEEEIDHEVRRRLRRMPSAPPEDSPEWETLFRKEKEALAARRGYVL